MRSLVFSVSFILAFLLFMVQPMATKMVLPTLGGSPAVWNTAMLLFQLLLLAGYFYAHILTHYVRPRLQVLVHALLVLASFVLLPIIVILPSSDAVIQHPITSMSSALLLQIGLPFFVVSATAPLLQSWVSQSDTPLAKTPYILYSASNLGSFLALIGYVVMVEPLFDLQMQRFLWSGLYAAAATTLLVTGYRLLRGVQKVTPMNATPTKKPRWSECAVWIVLAFLPSSLSLSVTSYVTTDIAAVPLLWVMPLAIYLLSFVDAFRSRPLLVPVCMRIAPVVGVAALWMYGSTWNSNIWALALHFSAFTVLALALHGYVAQAKPTGQHLTLFYFCLSIGGALGGVLNALVAPVVFSDTLEYPLTLAAAALVAWMFAYRKAFGLVRQARILVRTAVSILVLTLLFQLFFCYGASQGGSFTDIGMLTFSLVMAGVTSVAVERRFIKAFFAIVLVLLGMVVLRSFNGGEKTLLYKERNFFGVQKVLLSEKDEMHYFVHNTTIHGLQSLDKQLAMKPISYYSPLIAAFDALPVMRDNPMAVLGLGIGTLQCYAQASQAVDMFEINPLVVAIAENPDYFTYLRDCPGTHRVLLGDGRLRMAEQESQRYGALIIDVFTSDAIPTHLLTKEAFAVYLDKLAPRGVLIMNTTNRHMDLWPLIATQAKAMGWVAYGKHFLPDVSTPMAFESFWIIMAREPADIAPLLARQEWQVLTSPDRARVWTDQYTNILPYLRERKPMQ